MGREGSGIDSRAVLLRQKLKQLKIPTAYSWLSTPWQECACRAGNEFADRRKCSSSSAVQQSVLRGRRASTEDRSRQKYPHVISVESFLARSRGIPPILLSQ